MTAQCEGMGEVGSARYEPALLPPCPSIRVLSYSNCQEIHSRQQRVWAWPLAGMILLYRYTNIRRKNWYCHSYWYFLQFPLFSTAIGKSLGLLRLILDDNSDRIYKAEVASHHYSENVVKEMRPDLVALITAADKQMTSLVNWAKKIPHFTELPVEDQAILLNEGGFYSFLIQYTHTFTTIYTYFTLA